LERWDEANVFSHGEMRKKACLLNNVPNRTAETDGIVVGGGPAFDKNMSLRWQEHAIDEPQKSGFAAAAAAEEDQGFAGRDG